MSAGARKRKLRAALDLQKFLASVSVCVCVCVCDLQKFLASVSVCVCVCVCVTRWKAVCGTICD